ncbi:hypothetical protein HOLleu_21073 [Holothuria leucospilota]|uniref:Uncharacterized protein n=1 Tax=Holothuria leucospilota TaxID=206669 RepID=A0A9Q1BXE8_HOLLE|nr:hypothetical protein HOLleu_21073 [Holothuria leucospilota]
MSKRGRPAGSLGKKKREEAAALKSITSLATRLSQSSHREADFEDDDVSIASEGLAESINQSIELIHAELQKIRKEFGKAIELHKKQIKELQQENKSLKERCGTLEADLTNIKATQKEHTDQLNKQERHSRRSNVRIVGYKTTENEDCMKIAKEVFQKVGVPDCKIERAHRDGRIVRGRDRHILVKLSFFQDKVAITQNARQALAEDNFFITEDLTKLDLAEKKKWRTKVNDLFQDGVRLRFYAGCWRSRGGKPYDFNAPASSLTDEA